MSVAECTARIWWNKLCVSDRLRRLYYMSVQDVVSTHPGITNIVTYVPPFSLLEVVHGDGLLQIGRMRMVQHD